MERQLLVVGAKRGSLGDHVVKQSLNEGWRVTTAGVNEEQFKLDVLSDSQCKGIFRDAPFPHSVVCTVGINKATPVLDAKWRSGVEEQLLVNTLGPLTLLHHWLLELQERRRGEWREPPYHHHFVVVSSNSAQIARRQSLGYCASKAALSMGMRCAAREMAEMPVSLYVYEPGWLSDTPMSREVSRRLSESRVQAKGHRIPGGRAIDAAEFARMIVTNLELGRSLNGTVLRVDGGEQ